MKYDPAKVRVVMIDTETGVESELGVCDTLEPAVCEPCSDGLSVGFEIEYKTTHDYSGLEARVLAQMQHYGIYYDARSKELLGVFLAAVKRACETSKVYGNNPKTLIVDSYDNGPYWRELVDQLQQFRVDEPKEIKTTPHRGKGPRDKWGKLK